MSADAHTSYLFASVIGVTSSVEDHVAEHFQCIWDTIVTLELAAQSACGFALWLGQEAAFVPCAYECGERLAAAPDGDRRAAGRVHAAVCARHPMRDLERQVAELEAACRKGAAVAEDRFTGETLETSSRELLEAVQAGICACRDVLRGQGKWP